MMQFETSFIIASLLVVFLQHVASSEPNFIEDEDGLYLKAKHQWKRCKKSSDCDVGYTCRRRWCYPKHTCNINAHCPSNQYCDTSDNVCKPGQRVCKSHQECGYYMYCKNGKCTNKECHYYRRCSYGSECVKPGVCQLKKGFCKDQSHCRSDQCCLKRYGPHYAGLCKSHVRPSQWCDLKGKWSCPCVKGFTCTRKWWTYGKCTPEPTDEPGSGDIEAF